MQQWSWYVHRLRAMTPAEILWRAHTAARNWTDLWLLPGRQKSRLLDALGNFRDDRRAPLLNFSPAAGDFPQAWRQQLIERSYQIAKGRLTYFDMHDADLGNPIDWHKDHKSGKAAPRTPSQKIDYRDFEVTGDCKFVWEPNRHHQLVVLARAYRLTGEKKYATWAVEQLDGWLTENPYGLGMNWRSPLELGIRLINLVWMVDLISDSGLVAGEFRERLLNAVYLHLWEIARKYSRGSSANNHLVGEAAGVFVASSYFHQFKRSPQWQSVSRRILSEEIVRQTYPDGGPREQALGYHLFIEHFFLIAGLVGRRVGCEFPPEYWQRLEKMFEFSAAMIEAGDGVSNFGDCDDGYVLDLGGPHGDVSPWLAVAAVVFQRADFKAAVGEFSETALWLLGPEGRSKFDAIPLPKPPQPLRSRALTDSGYYLLQAGLPGQPDAMSVRFDCGELGLGSLAAHGHADALSFTLRALGREVLVDSGTYDYFSYPSWRQYFRSTRAHNTLVIDGQDQSEMLGLFLWGRRANATPLQWHPTEFGGVVSGEHDGYRCLADPVTHRRTVELDSRRGAVTVLDEVIAEGRHQVEAYFHFGESCRVRQVGEHEFEIDAGAGTLTFRVDPQLTLYILHGSEDPIAGWISRGYHQKLPCTTLVGRCVSGGNLNLKYEFLCRLEAAKLAPRINSSSEPSVAPGKRETSGAAT